MKTVLFTAFVLLAACARKNRSEQLPSGAYKPIPENNTVAAFDTSLKTIHVLVALCDNKYQGIVPVSAKIGNGQDPDNNLYWGWGYGVRTFFKNSNEWVFIRSQKKNIKLLERVVFKNKTANYYLVADAYDGRNMKECMQDYLSSLSGSKKDTVISGKDTVGINGNSRLVCFIGHDGLMDIPLENNYTNKDGIQRDCITLACYSKQYFKPYITKAGANPLLWTTNLMGPEAYTLHDALTGYVKGEDENKIRQRAAEAYSKYTKCSVKAAKGLIVTGW